MNQTISWKEGIAILCLCLCTWALSAPLRDTSRAPGWQYGSDSLTYLDLAMNLRAGRGYVNGPAPCYFGAMVNGASKTYYHNTNVLPGYPLLLVAASAVAGMVHGPYLLAFFLFILMSFCLYGASKLLFSNILSASALWISFIIFHILQPILIVQLQSIARDLASATSIALFLLMLLRLMLTPKLTTLTFVGLIVATIFAAAIRTNIFAFMFPLLFIIGVIFWLRRERRKIAVLALDILTVVACVMAWGLYLKNFSGTFSLGTDQGSSLYVNYVYDHVPRTVDDEVERQITDDFERRLARGVSVERAEIESSVLYKQKTLEFFRGRPGLFLKLSVINILRTFFQKDYFWLPKVVFVEAAGYGPEDYYKFREIYSQSHSPLARVSFAIFYGGCYIVYVVVPALALLLMPFLSWRGMKVRDIVGRSRLCVETILFSLSVSAIIFIVATSILGASQARYRMPISAVNFLCILGSLAILRKPGGRARGGALDGISRDGDKISQT